MLHEKHLSAHRFWDTVPGSLIGISQNFTWINYKHIHQNHPNLAVGDKTLLVSVKRTYCFNVFLMHLTAG